MAVILSDPPLYLGKLNSGDPNINYQAYNDRALVDAIWQKPGCIQTTGFKVTENTGALGFIVKVGAGTAIVPGTTASNQGDYLVRLYADTTITTPTPAAAARVHRVVLVVQDNQFDSSGFSRAYIDVLTSSSTTPPAVPANAISLGLISIAAAQANVSNANLTDNRPMTGLPFLAYTSRSSLTTSVTPTSTWVPVKFNGISEFVGQGAFTHSSNDSAFVCQRGGTYEIAGSFSIATVAGTYTTSSAFYGIISVTPKGTALAPATGLQQGTERVAMMGGAGQALSISLGPYPVVLNAGDTVELKAYSNSTANQSILVSNSGFYPFISLKWVEGQ